MACKTTGRAAQFFSRGIAFLALAAIFFPSAAAHAEDKPAADPAKKFDHVGPQPGDQIPEVPLRTLKDEPMSLRTVCEQRPTLLVTSSFTCPKSRSRWPELQDLAAKYEGQLQVVIVYVIEAHPTDDICPYKGVEDVTEENRRDGILRRQPKTLEARLDLANEFRSHLGVKVPIYVDTMKNTAWTALGAAPNLALLVRAGGKVEHRQGWFSAEDLEPAVDKFLESLPKPVKRNAKKPDADGETSISKKLKAAGIDEYKLRRIFSQDDTGRSKKLLDTIPELATYISEYEARGHSGGRSLLNEAAQAGAIQQMELLLSHGADINAQTKNVASALHLTAARGKRDVAEFLIRHGADVNLASLKSGDTPLQEAVFNERPAMVDLLVKAGAKEDFFTRCGMGKLEEVRRNLKADPARAFIPDGSERTPLCYAAATNQVKILALLIEPGAPVAGDLDSSGHLPIQLAAERGHAQAASVLLKAGVSPNSRHSSGESVRSEGSPLHIAIKGKHVEVARVLIGAGADFTLRNRVSQTPLHFAAQEGATEIVKAILAAKADPNPLTEKFNLPCGPHGGYPATHDTPLHLAAEWFQPETAAALIAGGAKIEAENAAGMTPLAVAVMPDEYKLEPERAGQRAKQRLETVRVLVAAGASTDCIGKDGKPIREALRKTKESALLNLLDRR